MSTFGLDRALAAGPGWPPGFPLTGPLGGVRVLDLSRVLAGPYCCLVLADLGADVLKVERPGIGDDTRHWGPPVHGADAAYFLSVNRDRRSFTLDLTRAAGRSVVTRLAQAADVVMAQARSGLMSVTGAAEPTKVAEVLTALGLSDAQVEEVTGAHGG